MDILNFLQKELNPPPLGSESCSLAFAAGRVLAADIVSPESVPLCDESTRDGFALGKPLDAAENSYKLIEEEAFAGNTNAIKLGRGQACHVMTGGIIPIGAERVVPKELAGRSTGSLLKVCDLTSLPDFIKRRGSELQQGQSILEKGTILRADHLAMLATISCEIVEVFRKPKVGILATGSELIELGQDLKAGQKIASNKFLLSQLCSNFGADIVDLGIINDEADKLYEFFSTLKQQNFDAIITTGGMGPGKYDLLQKTFCDVGGKMTTNRLPISPGKSTLVGWLDDSLFFGLPGNPSAVKPLFVELIAPGLLCMQGVESDFPKAGKAILQTVIDVKTSSHTALKPGFFEFQGITRIVRSAEKGEVANCYILIGPESKPFPVGSVALIHEITSPFCD